MDGDGWSETVDGIDRRDGRKERSGKEDTVTWEAERIRWSGVGWKGVGVEAVNGVDGVEPDAR